ncbi:hypothetical protein [Desulfosporosinus nitroreducens]|uniref:Uncharacterized protein n=1 Tax=Desulfosporosinus nitroreducens TaxID=2018668 RepID=A0ABT8QRT1_9FIRM|nr:hypothetical protein [Desulfosporosinus nitroreducens]MDO0824049.1 hypothetical protein [Desulfosporosinus nitroreducens]
MNRVGIFTQEEIIKKCQKNPRIKDGGSEFLGSRITENECPFKFHELKTPQELFKQIGMNPRFIREVCVFNSLAFINQIPDNGDEWWALKKYPDDSIKFFSNITFENMIVSGWTPKGNMNERIIVDLDTAKSPEELDNIWESYLPEEKNMIERAYEIGEEEMECDPYDEWEI